ncbi:hypothetical protein V7024_01855 [Bacillus sp. JJ864]|uniref:hypothetical protein n=1 Tax=Bacillus sp. JJ864 TaxID=3122975 RepID=UPI002FFE2E79
MSQGQSISIEANNDINEISFALDIISDEYSNYYYVLGTTVEHGKLTEVKISHSYYEDSFSEVLHDKIEDKYKFKHIGHILRDRLLRKLELVKERNRKIFTIQELLANGIKVNVMKPTQMHPRANDK